jgi:hypothetical protein
MLFGAFVRFFRALSSIDSFSVAAQSPPVASPGVRGLYPPIRMHDSRQRKSTTLTQEHYIGGDIRFRP